jgi:hypothetical protein
VIKQRGGFYHIDTSRIAVYRNSSGGTAALWLGFSDRINPYVVGGYEVQGTFDMIQWEPIFEQFSITLQHMFTHFGIRQYCYSIFGVSSTPELRATSAKLTNLAGARARLVAYMQQNNC